MPDGMIDSLKNFDDMIIIFLCSENDTVVHKAKSNDSEALHELRVVGKRGKFQCSNAVTNESNANLCAKPTNNSSSRMVILPFKCVMVLVNQEDDRCMKPELTLKQAKPAQSKIQYWNLSLHCQ